MARDRVLLDVNALAIYLVEDHPGHKFIGEEIDPSLRGKRELLVFDYLPFRAYWVLTTKWNISKDKAQDAITSFLDQPFKMVCATRETIKNAYKIAKKKNHDVYDCFYLALARQENATKILTTDEDFKKLCKREKYDYLNPVPQRILEEFKQV